MRCFCVFVLQVALLLLSISASATTPGNTSPYSEPFHKQGRGWYPSFYWSTGRNLGSYFAPNTDGEPFKPVTDREFKSETHGLIYFYRPESQWASEEMEAPTYYLEDEVIFNLRGGSYTWVQLPEGQYDFAVRKSLIPIIGFEAFDDKLLMAFDMNLQANVGLNIVAGKTIFIRHSEVKLPEVPHPDLSPEDPMLEADVQLVTEEYAMSEMKHTRYLTPGFWTPNDSLIAKEVIDKTDIEYGWFSVIWPWSNNFVWGFPIWYVPSEMINQLKPEQKEKSIEQILSRYENDPDAYVEAIEQMRKKKRNWLMPWQEPANDLSTNDMLLLEKLERAAKAKQIIKYEGPDSEAGKGRLDWLWPF